MDGEIWHSNSSFTSISRQMGCGSSIANKTAKAMMIHEKILPNFVKSLCFLFGLKRPYRSIVTIDEIAKSAESTVLMMAATAAERKRIIIILIAGTLKPISCNIRIVICSLPRLSRSGN